MMRLILLCSLITASCQTVQSNNYCSGYIVESEVGDWYPEDTAQVTEAAKQCQIRYNKCLKKFHKVADKRYWVLCGNKQEQL